MKAMLAVIALLSAIHNPLTDPNAFPIAVWLQEPSNAQKYKAAGFNLYVGLWEGPTERQLADLKAAEMPVICEQNPVGLAHRNDATIIGWMHQDEPDNAQPIKDAQGRDGYGPCVPPPTIVDRYAVFKRADPTRPVMLNLGQGVANDQWIGRGNGAKLSDYETYVKGGDIVSFDIYPVASFGDPTRISLIAKGLDRLQGWTNGKKRIWNCLECTAISGQSKVTPVQLVCEAWLSVIHGSRGLIYFVHQFQPKFDEHALLDDPQMLQAATSLNRELQRFAEALNRGRPVTGDYRSSASVDHLLITHGGKTYLFTANPTASSVEASIALSGSHAVDGLTGANLPAKQGRARIDLPPFGVRIAIIG